MAEGKVVDIGSAAVAHENVARRYPRVENAFFVKVVDACSCAHV
jgi:hypothetical protein